MYSCQDVLAELSAFVDDDVTAAVRREIEHHLAECRTCQVLVDSTRKTLKIVTTSGTFELSPAASERIVSGIMSRLQSGRL